MTTFRHASPSCWTPLSRRGDSGGGEFLPSNFRQSSLARGGHNVAPIVRPFVPVKMAEADIQPVADEIVFAAAAPHPEWTEPLVAEPEPQRSPPASNPDFEDFVNTAKRAGF
jgi:hypothetical protein